MSGIHTPTILVVDDDELVLQTVRQLLEADGYAAETAVSVGEALGKLRERPFSGILCDMWMPVLTGRDLYATLEREMPQLCARTIFLTGDLASEFTWDFIEGKELPYILKPFNIADFRKKVRAVLSESETPEKRVKERKPASGRALVRKRQWCAGGPDIAPVVNISQTGLLFVTERQYYPGADVSVAFPHIGCPEIEESGVVVRVKPVSEAQWSVAVAFGAAADRYRAAMRQ